MLWCSVALLALVASVQGRAVNISNTWVLPEEGFPVFYRYFRDRISWYEADAVCQFHHANLVTVDTTAQYDAVRAYLKELDISSAVWVGLIRSNPDGDFTWTDYRGLSGDGYWSSAPDARAAPLCAAANPVADYRWEVRACGGPTVASFICELPVPQWALGNEGCMVRALPALTILYLPESAAVQLTADCGMAGVKRVQCTGNVKRDDLLRDLSCADEDELSSIPSLTSIGSSWPITTDLAFTDQETTNEITTEVNISTEREIDINKANITKETAIPDAKNIESETPKILTDKYKLKRIMLNKNINFDVMQSNNLQSNFIPKIANKDNIITNEEQEKLEDEKYMQHKMLHEEIARLGNLENIFTQPTDHFVPPLVMAKAKISDDMTVLSLEEKHAQQLATQQIIKQNIETGQKLSTETPKSNKQPIQSQYVQPTKLYDSGRKDKTKSYIPKKYHEKYYDPKGKILKTIDTKSLDIEKTTEIPPTPTDSIKDDIENTTIKVTRNIYKDKSDEEDSSMDLTVMIKDAPVEIEEKTNYSDISKSEIIKNHTSFNETEIMFLNEKNVSQANDYIPENINHSLENVTMAHEIIKISIIAEESSSMTPTVFEITTKMPVFRASSNNNYTLPPTTLSATMPNIETYNTSGTSINSVSNISSTSIMDKEEIGSTTAAPVKNPSTVIGSTLEQSENSSFVQAMTSTDRTFTTKDEFLTATTTSLHNTQELEKNITEDELTSNVSNSTPNEKIDIFNNTEIHDVEFETNSTESEAIDDFQSPLLSAANEPLHRPNRSRRPQPQPNRNKFNPFRILG